MSPRAVPAVAELVRAGAAVALDAKLEARAAPFRRTFGGQPGEPEDPSATTLDQALFLKHGGTIRGMIAPRAGNLMDRLGKLPDPQAVIDELFLSVLSRPPTDQERADVAAALQGVSARGGDPVAPTMPTAVPGAIDGPSLNGPRGDDPWR